MRNKGVTGSDITILMSDDNYKTLKGLYNKKAYAEHKEFDNNAMKFGRRNEESVAHIFSTIYNLEVEEFNFMVSKNDNEFMKANIDYLFTENGQKGILEIKTGNEGQIKKWEDDKIPKNYFYQVLFYLYVFNLPYGYIFALIGGKQEEGDKRYLFRRRIQLEGNERLLEKMVTRINRFEKYLSDLEFPNEKEYKELMEKDKEVFNES